MDAPVLGNWWMQPSKTECQVLLLLIMAICLVSWSFSTMLVELTSIEKRKVTVLAKNLTGYKNLVKIVSNSWTDGFYGSPRTDRVDLEKYHEGLIVLSGSAGSEVFTKISKGDIEGLEETIRWYQQTFGEDYYLELHRCADYDLKSNTPSHLMLEQQKVNTVLIQKATEYGIKVVATNDVHYVAPEDLAVYNIQQCVATGKTNRYTSIPLVDKQKIYV